MAFWSTNDVEPKRNFRFKVQITGLASNTGAPTDVLWWAKTVTTPGFDVSEVEHNYLDNKFYFPGRVSWNEVSLTLVDPISVDAVSITNELLVKSGYSVKASETSLQTMSKNKATSSGIEKIVIEILNADGIAIETWTLNQPFIKSAKYGDLDYSSDDLRTVELSVRYDWAECVTKAPSANPGTFFQPV
jgi:hypothetical protein